MFRFNTRDKKPKLYNELVLLAVAAALSVAASFFPGLLMDKLLAVIATVFFFVSVIVFLDAFRKQVNYNPYSYNTIFYFGFALFILSIAIRFLIYTINLFKTPEMYRGLLTFVSILETSAVNYMLISAPFILAFSAALFISNISLIRHETRTFRNLLGMVLAVLLVFGEIIIYQANLYVSGSQLQVMIVSAIINAFAAIYLYAECMIIGSMVAGALTALYKPDPDADYIIILGCRVRPDGKPYPLLKGRIDKALEFYHTQLEKTGKAAVFIPSGGKGPDEAISEGECMKQYLMENGILPEHIICEDRAENTYENFSFSKELIPDLDEKSKIIFATTNYHVFRSGLMSRRIKLRSIGIGAKTRWYFWPNAAVREFVGLLTRHRIKQLVILAGLILIFIAFSVIEYSV